MIYKWLSLGDCEHGFLYLVNARNFTYGVYNEKQKGFIGIRHKFKMVFLDLEFHWDTGAPYGTVKPINVIKKCPIDFDETLYPSDTKFDTDKKLFNWLNDNTI